MPAFAGPLLGFTLGVALAWASRQALERDDERRRARRTRVVALFAALVFAPACGYFLVAAPDWSLAYLADSRAVPSAAALLLVVLDGAAVVAGFLAGRRAVERRGPRAAVALGAASATAAAVAVLAVLPALRVDGTFHEVHSHFGTEPVVGGPLGLAVLWMNAMIAAGFTVAARALSDRPRALPRGPGDQPARFLGRG